MHGCTWQFGHDKHVIQLWVHIIGMNRRDLKCPRKVAATESPLSGEDLAVSATGILHIPFSALWIESWRLTATLPGVVGEISRHGLFTSAVICCLADQQ